MGPPSVTWEENFVMFLPLPWSYLQRSTGWLACLVPRPYWIEQTAHAAPHLDALQIITFSRSLALGSFITSYLPTLHGPTAGSTRSYLPTCRFLVYRAM